MAGFMNFLTQTGILLESDMIGTLIISYVFLLFVLFVSFLNIYSIDKHEFLNNKQKCLEFKHKMFFIITFSKNKHIISLKTFAFEVICYLLSISLIVVFIYSLKQEVSVSYILLGILASIVLIFGCITGSMYGKTKKNN